MQRKSISVALALVLAATLPAAMAQPNKASRAAKAEKAAPAAAGKISVNGVMIPQAYFDAMNREREHSNQPAPPDMQGAIKEELVNREVLSQAAKKKMLDKDPTVAAQMDMARQAVLIRAFFDNYVKSNPVTDAQLKANYDKLTAQMGNKEYKARHILVDTEDEAKAVIAGLTKGEDFNKLAKEKSKDTGSKDNGGDLDWAPAGRYVPEFGDALKALQKGQTTNVPVKTQFGFHVIRLEESRDLKVPTFDEAKENLRQRAQQEQIAKLVQDLRAQAKVEEK